MTQKEFKPPHAEHMDAVRLGSDGSGIFVALWVPEREPKSSQWTGKTSRRGRWVLFTRLSDLSAARGELLSRGVTKGNFTAAARYLDDADADSARRGAHRTPPDAAERWRRANPEEVAKHDGKQIAIHPERGIVASDESLRAVYDRVKELGLLDEVVFDSVSTKAWA